VSQYPKPCPHKRQTLCQYDDATYGHFVAYQCDDCGMVTQREVSAEDLEQADLPWIDDAMWRGALAAATDRVFGVPDLAALRFMARAVR
jgi:hypothetical protein